MEKYLELLTKLVSFKSISTDPAYQSEITKLVKWLTAEFKAHGFTTQILQGPTANLVIFASYVHNPTFPSVLIYGHYDVQPAKKNDGWNSDPFTIKTKNGRLYGRGVVDDKGQIAIHIATVFDLILQGKLAYNIKFLIEGNEETANPDLPELLKSHKSELACDYVLVSDGEIINDRPTIDASLRGGFNVKVTYTTANTNLHSGIYGGAIPNAAFELAKFVSHLKPFTQDVDPITSDQISNNKSIPVDLKSVGVKAQFGTHDFYSQTGLNPSIEITGFKSGYIDSGFANIVPSSAEVRLNFRIVTSQKPVKIFNLFKQYLAKNTPKFVQYTVEPHGFHNPVKLNSDSEIYKKAEKLLEQIYQHPVFYQNVGGAIPFISDVKETLGIDTLSVSLANSDCNMHGINENFRIDLIEKGLRFSQLFFTNTTQS